MIFGRPVTPKRKQIKLDLISDISIDLIDVAHLELHPSFVIPESVFSIQAIGKIKNTGEQRDVFNVYTENNGRSYLIEIEAIEDKIELVTLYQNILTLNPTDSDEWKEMIDSISQIEIDMDGAIYKRTLGGNVNKADLCKLAEHIKTKDGEIDYDNQVMLFERKIDPGNFTEKIKAAVEVNEASKQASLSFYIGFSVHPSMVTILGN